MLNNVKKWSCFQALTFILGLALLSCTAPKTYSQTEAELLWPNGNPNNWQAEQAERRVIGNDQVLRVSHVNSPSLTYFPPAKGAPPTSTAVVICPGGGYRILAISKEGDDVARFLAANGYHAFVLKYRLPNQGEPRHQAALEDARRSIELVRSRSEELGLDRVGIMGFSAGGHLAAATAAAADHESQAERLDFVALIYPAYFLDDNLEHLNLEVKPKAGAPPAFLVHALNDRIPARNSVVYAEALADLKIPAEVHLYARGGHGYGMTLTDKLPVGDWPQHLLGWLQRRQ